MADRARLTRELLSTSNDIQRLMKKRRILGHCWSLNPDMEDVCIAACGMCGGSIAPAVKFLDACARERHWPECPRPEIVAVIEHIVKHAGDRFDALVHHIPSANARAVEVAARYAREAFVVDCVKRANEQCGIAPCSQWLLERAEEFTRSVPDVCKPRVFGSAREKASQNWLRRLRRVWDGRLRRIAAIAPMTKDEFSNKVRRACERSCVR